MLGSTQSIILKNKGKNQLKIVEEDFELIITISIDWIAFSSTIR